jgi:hypothetical protein
MRKLIYNVISNYLQTTCHPTTCHQTLCCCYQSKSFVFFHALGPFPTRDRGQWWLCCKRRGHGTRNNKLLRIFKKMVSQLQHKIRIFAPNLEWIGIFVSMFGFFLMSLGHVKGIESLNICYGFSFLKVYGNERTHATLFLTTELTFWEWAWSVTEELSELSVLKGKKLFFN